MINYDQTKVEVDGLPEYVRDSDVTSRDAFVSISTRSLAEREAHRTASTERQSQRDTGNFNRVAVEVDTPRTDELEALWPGVHQDFLHSPKRTPSFYLTLGFLAGAFISMVGIWGYSAVSGMVVANTAPAGGNKVAAATAGTPSQTVAVAVPQGGDPNAMLTPAHQTVEIGSGDTLAAIALREYKRVSPRLLDEICRANGLKNANFLSLGQKINLPNYQPAAQVAATAGAQVH